YSYACNDFGEGHPEKRPQYLPEPGELGGSDKQADLDCKEIKKAVQLDSDNQPNYLGMIPYEGKLRDDQLPPKKENYYLVALVIAPGVDFHWYRQDDNGKWSHKPGPKEVTNLDALKKEIDNPCLCSRDYSKAVKDDDDE